jgi:hypothetical protein
MNRLPKSWRWPVAGLLLGIAAALFVPMGGLMWLHLTVTLLAVGLLARPAHTEFPFPVALAQVPASAATTRTYCVRGSWQRWPVCPAGGPASRCTG